MRYCLEDSARYIPDLSLPPRQTGVWDQSGLSLGYPTLLSGAALDVAFSRAAARGNGELHSLYYIILFVIFRFYIQLFHCLQNVGLLLSASVFCQHTCTLWFCGTRNLFIDLHL